jgi:hypothetical protein
VDSGALLFPQNTIHKSREKQETATARGIARAMQAMDCRAVGIAARDLAGGIDLLKELQATEKLSRLSMNIVDQAGNHPVFRPFIQTMAGTVPVAILGLTDHQAARLQNPAYTILPWQEVLPDIVKQAQKNSDMIILLSSYPENVNKKIAHTVKGIDLILQSGHHAANQVPHKVDNTLLAQAGGRGKYLGMMRIHWTDAGEWGQGFEEQIRAEQNQLDRINWQIGRMVKRAKGNNLESNERYKKLLTARERSSNAIKELKTAKESEAEEPCSFTNRFIGLKSSLPEDPKVQNIIDQTTRKVNTLNRQRTRKSQKQPSPALALQAGSDACSECHPEQARFWQTTGHGKAWQTLAENNQQFNEDCLLCHVTLPQYDPVLVQAKNLLVHLPEKLRNVGCESCHGPSLAHSRNPESSQPLLPQESTCRQCHNPERDDNFIYADKVEKIRCPRG